jgi:hypothetical protein
MYDYEHLIEAAEYNASQGYGQSEFLYESRVQTAYASILSNAPEEDRGATEAALRGRGFDPDHIAEYDGADDECGLTGIRFNHCPCGRHP